MKTVQVVLAGTAHPSSTWRDELMRKLTLMTHLSHPHKRVQYLMAEEEARGKDARLTLRIDVIGPTRDTGRMSDITRFTDYHLAAVQHKYCYHKLVVLKQDGESYLDRMGVGRYMYLVQTEVAHLVNDTQNLARILHAEVAKTPDLLSADEMRQLGKELGLILENDEDAEDPYYGLICFEFAPTVSVFIDERALLTPFGEPKSSDAVDALNALQRKFEEAKKKLFEPLKKKG